MTSRGLDELKSFLTFWGSGHIWTHQTGRHFTQSRYLEVQRKAYKKAHRKWQDVCYGKLSFSKMAITTLAAVHAFLESHYSPIKWQSLCSFLLNVGRPSWLPPKQNAVEGHVVASKARLQKATQLLLISLDTCVRSLELPTRMSEAACCKKSTIVHVEKPHGKLQTLKKERPASLMLLCSAGCSRCSQPECNRTRDPEPKPQKPPGRAVPEFLTCKTCRGRCI